ncbi:MAG: winged helix-turn-helix domain-containing protein [Oscillospiraceae bacterium]|nr:winged helix-turn-helix domain-containing protein [Oscillospiraceae bacterium]
MADIRINMLGKFDIIVDGNSILPALGNSSKSILLLKYLILNRNKPVSSDDLIDIFWSESENSANPANALKTMVSRLRTNLTKASPGFKDCILAENRSYAWNPDIKCDVDVFIFEDLCGEIKNFDALTDETRAKCNEALYLYGDDLAHAAIEEDWILARSLYLHHLYMKMVYKFVELLRLEADYDAVIQVCRIALDVDTFDETLNMELMNALNQGGDKKAALLQYSHLSSVYQKYLGVEPSEKMAKFYKTLLKTHLASEADIHAIIKSLKSQDDNHNSAFVCNYPIFKDIYHLNTRNMGRQKNKMFLCLASLSSLNPEIENLDPMMLENTMKILLSVLIKCLRKGDTISRYSPSQYVVLLPMMNYANGQIIMHRIRSIFYKQCSENLVRISFQFEEIDHR